MINYFRLQAGQVTQHCKWHAWSGDTCCLRKFAILEDALSLVSSYVGGFVFFPRPFAPRLPPLSYDTSVFLDKCPMKYRTGVLTKSLQHPLQTILLSFTLVKAKPTAWRRLWGSVTPISPLTKRERLLCVFLFEELSWIAHDFVQWQPMYAQKHQKKVTFFCVFFVGLGFPALFRCFILKF